MSRPGTEHPLLTATVENPIGLHARPAVKLTMLAKQFDASIELRSGPQDDWVNAKSPNEVMKVKARRGQRLFLRATGPHAPDALTALRQLLERDTPRGLGERVITGTPAAPGLVIGEVVRDAPLPPQARVDPDPGNEASTLDQAIQQAEHELRQAMEVDDTLAADILEFQLALLQDSAFVAPILQAVPRSGSAASAWSDALGREIDAYIASGSEHRAARADDLRDLEYRVLRILAGQATPLVPHPAGAILVAEHLTPSRFLELDWSRLGGAVVQGGSATSHVSILARARGVPMVVAADDPIRGVSGGMLAILDAEQGRFVVDPTEGTLERVRRQMAVHAEISAEAQAHLPHPASTADGVRIVVRVNVNDPTVIDRVNPDHCDGIGLARTELFYGDAAPLDEETQLAAYRRIVEWAAGKPVTFRTFDTAADKPVAAFDSKQADLLGMRGVRMCLADPAVFVVQLRALARAAAVGPVRILVPMVTVPRELDQVRRLLRGAVRELSERGIPHALPPLGMMVEVPAAALTASSFDADFFAIGSNDLVQYTTACARENPAVAHLAEPENPAVFELIERVVQAGKARGVEVSLCGSMASEPAIVPSLLRSGLRSLSVEPAQLARVKQAVSRSRTEGSTQ